MNLSIQDGRAELWQWDTGVRLVMDEACEAVNLSEDTFGVTVDVTAAEDGKTWVAAVPDEMLQKPGDLICYAVQSTATGTITAAYRSSRVNRRPKPAGYVATPTEARTWQKLDDKKIDAPQVAQVGEVLTVEEVYADGKPKKWKTQMIDAGYDTILAAIDQAVFDKQLLVDILAGTCENLTGDAITAIADYVFYMKQSLKTIDLPNCVSVGNNAFYGCGALTAVDLPMATSIGNYAFCICTALTTVDLPMATSIGNSMLYGCTALTAVDLPMATSIGDFTFRDCTALTNVNLPVATSIARNAFQSCIALTSINLPMVTSIGNYTFFRCFSLTALVLSGTNVCTLANENAFGNCYHILGTTDSIYNPTGAKDGYIYVPDDLVDSYKSATNWTTYASQIKPLSEFAGVA